jgi:hypothetical protein
MRNASRRRLSGGATYRAEGQLGGHQQRGVGAVAPGQMKGRGRGMWLRNGDTVEGYRVPVPFRSERLNRVISCPLDRPPADWAGRLGC